MEPGTKVRLIAYPKETGQVMFSLAVSDDLWKTLKAGNDDILNYIPVAWDSGCPKMTWCAASALEELK